MGQIDVMLEASLDGFSCDRRTIFEWKFSCAHFAFTNLTVWNLYDKSSHTSASSICNSKISTTKTIAARDLRAPGPLSQN